SRTRRNALPRVWPKPRSSGSTTPLARCALSFSTVTPRGRSTLMEALAIQAFSELLGIQLDDEAFVDVGRQVDPLGQRLEHAAELLAVDIDPARYQVHLVRQGDGLLDTQLA